MKSVQQCRGGKDGDVAETWLLTDGQLDHVMAQNVHLLADSIQTWFKAQWTRHEKVGLTKTGTYNGKCPI